MRRNLWRTACFLALLAAAVPHGAAHAQGNGRAPAVIAFSQSVTVDGATLQIDFSEGTFDLPRAEIIERLQQCAHTVAVYYGRFPVPRVRIIVTPVAGRHGILQGTTWGNRSGFPAYLRLRIGQSTTHEELFNDWIITHELSHTALADQPDDQHWLEEGIASYVEPIARVQAGDMDVKSLWAGIAKGMPNGEPGSGDSGLNNTHSWGRTYWGGALFCLMADVEIRRQTQNRKGLQDALRAIVAAGGTIDTNWPVARLMHVGDEATGTHVLEDMYAKWSESPVTVDLPQLWKQLGVVDAGDSITLNPKAPLAAIRIAITSPSDKSRL